MAKASSKTTTIEPKAEPLAPEQPAEAPEQPAAQAVEHPAEAETAPEQPTLSVPPVLDPPPEEPPASPRDLVLAEVTRAMSSFATSEQLLVEMRRLVEPVADGPIPPGLTDAEAARVIDALVAECRKAMDRLSAPRMARREIDEHLRRLISRARRLDAPPPKPVLYFEVTETSRYIVDGTITTLHRGSVISSLTHSIADVEAQKVPLRRCGPPRAHESHVASGFQVSPSNDFEIEEHADPLLRALGGGGQS